MGQIFRRRLKTPIKIKKGNTPIILRTRAAINMGLKLKFEEDN